MSNKDVHPLMPKAKAIWLVDNTSVTFQQIADFCGLHITEIQAMANNESTDGIIGQSPILSGELSKEEIARCQQDAKQRLQFIHGAKTFLQVKKAKRSKYTPVVRRRDKPDAILWMIKNCTNINDIQIVKLVGTTKAMIASIRNKEYWNFANLKPRDPVILGLCNQIDLDHLLTLNEKVVATAMHDSGHGL